ncbi:hypothetical protein EDD36DRAFT_459464 [Exophiala viscosa]|uniref:Ribonucleases P/MRP subunit Pop8-like domain-containing protein n=1 Tax=Exophiala viscosa TaxID=2486360 RepID=A0AAN6E4F9_9EURO|nr:hypothetical protein EDD36DRAFT_459464 [Exophiala viscosa]
MTTAKATQRESTTTAFTMTNPPYAYFQLSSRSLSPQASQGLDDITARSYLTAALQQYLGLTGVAIPVDILKTEEFSVWIRVPRDDEAAVTAAVSQWASQKGVSLKIDARGSWLGGVVARGGRDAKLWTLER